MSQIIKSVILYSFQLQFFNERLLDFGNFFFRVLFFLFQFAWNKTFNRQQTMEETFSLSFLENEKFFFIYLCSRNYARLNLNQTIICLVISFLRGKASLYNFIILPAFSSMIFPHSTIY